MERPAASPFSPCPLLMSFGLVEVPYSLLAATPEAPELDSLLAAAFGPDGLGACVVSGVPGYPEARARLLPLASQLAELPPASLAALEDPESRYNFGWSHGKERLGDGRVGEL